jgi:GTP-binding protein HflX
LVGYTNAGKSTLFNTLTHAHVYAKDQLFATLDPTLRRLELPGGSNLVLADTVGFVSRLPHDLVAAFKSTLQETIEADLLLHVIDVASVRRAENIAEVEDVLKQIGADEVPRLDVYNKIDLLDEPTPRIDRDEYGRPIAVWVSAAAHLGMDLLLQALQELFGEGRVRCQARLGPADGRLHALLFKHGQVLSESITDDGGWELEVELAGREYERLRKNEPVLESQWEPLDTSD